MVHNPIRGGGIVYESIDIHAEKIGLLKDGSIFVVDTDIPLLMCGNIDVSGRFDVSSIDAFELMIDHVSTDEATFAESIGWFDRIGFYGVTRIMSYVLNGELQGYSYRGSDFVFGFLDKTAISGVDDCTIVSKSLLPFYYAFYFNHDADKSFDEQVAYASQEIEQSVRWGERYTGIARVLMYAPKLNNDELIPFFKDMYEKRTNSSRNATSFSMNQRNFLAKKLHN